MTDTPIRKASLANQVEQILIDRIKSGVYPPGGRMPTEEKLAEEFDVSRATIRAAFNALTANHIIVRRHGVGTFVSQAAKLPNPLDQSIDFLELIASSGFSPGFKELMSRIIVPGEDVQRKLDLVTDQRVLEVHKVFTADGKPVIYSQNYISEWVYRNVLTDDQAVARVHGQIDRRRNIEIERPGVIAEVAVTYGIYRDRRGKRSDCIAKQIQCDEPLGSGIDLIDTTYRAACAQSASSVRTGCR